MTRRNTSNSQQNRVSTKKKIKVLQLGNAGSLYGAERWILALIKYLDADLIETWVATIRDEPNLEAPLCSEAEKLGFNTEIFNFYGKFNFSAIRCLRKFIQDNHINIIHTHHYKTDIIGLLATIGTPCKIVATPHGWSKEMDLKLWCYEMMDRFIFPLMDGVVPLSEDIYRPLKNIPLLKKKIYLIQNGVDISEIDTITELSQQIKKWKNNGTFIIGYIGQLIQRKGIDILLKAMAQITSKDWQLVLIGEGEQRNDLEQMSKQLGISERVSFMGFRSDRIAFLKGFDIFVLPSKLEGIPRCLMESLAAKTPVIASDIPGCRDLITNRENGLLFQQDNPSELAQAIDLLLKNPKMCDKFTKFGRKLVTEKFSAEQMARNYVTYFTAILQ